VNIDVRMSNHFSPGRSLVVFQEADIVVVIADAQSGTRVAYAAPAGRPLVVRDGQASAAGGDPMALVLRLALAGLIVAVVTALAAFSLSS
jgi:hypothetical protein